jgi:hypothetical protein
MRPPRVLTWAAFALHVGCVRAGPTEPAPSGETTSAASGQTQTPSAETVELDSKTPGWEPSRRYVYRLSLTSTVTVEQTGSPVDFDLHGNVEIQPTEAGSSEGLTLVAAVTSAKATSRAPGLQPSYDKLVNELNRAPCFLTMVGGRVTHMQIPKGASQLFANTFRTIASSLQFARPAKPSPRYGATEYDSTGQYVAEYEAGGEANSWRKRKGRYLSLLGASRSPQGAMNIIPLVKASEGTIKLGPDGRPNTVSLRDEISVQSAQAPVFSTTIVSLEETSATPAVPRDWGKMLAQTDKLEAGAPFGVGAAIEALDAARIGGLAFEQVVSRFEALAKDKDAPPPAASKNGAPVDPEERARQESALQDRSRLFVALAALFRQKPALIPKAIAKIRTKSSATEVLIDALGSSSSADAQQALLTLSRSTWANADVKARATAALGRASQPSEQTIASFEAKLAENPHDTQTLFSLGTHSRHLRDEGHTEQASRLGELLVARLHEANTTSSQVDALRAIANSGYSGALPTVMPFLRDGRDLVRGVALRALQSMTDPRVDSLIATSMVSDSAASVRISAIEAAQVRTPTEALSSSLRNTAASAEDPHVRYRAVDLMRRWLPMRPELRASLERVSKEDEQARIRELAKGAL